MRSPTRSGPTAGRARKNERTAISGRLPLGRRLSMAMCPDGGLLMLGSSVHRKVGYMYRKYKHLHGNDDSEDICWFAPSAVMNPQLPLHVIDKASGFTPTNGALMASDSFLVSEPPPKTIWLACRYC